MLITRNPLAHFLSFIVLFCAFAMISCKPKYPNCKEDADCQEKVEVCVNNTCQECRDDAQCVTKYGDSHRCDSGRCQAKATCKTDEDCPQGQTCKNQLCSAECSVDTDCGMGVPCVSGQCQRSTTGVSADCRPMAGRSGEIIAIETIAFEFDQHDLTAAGRSSLDKAAECMQKSPQVQVVLEGHCDDRGTQEYNLALGEKRANTVLKYLSNLGVNVSRMKTRSKGENEPVCRETADSCWTQNRRVEFIQKMAQ